MNQLRPQRVAIPALKETAMSISARDTGVGVMRALNPSTMMTMYVDDVLRPATAMALDRARARALADAEPGAVARYAPELVLASSAAARRRP
eukprot:455605-Alexandrium_andersonii.AAC.1